MSQEESRPKRYTITEFGGTLNKDAKVALSVFITADPTWEFRTPCSTREFLSADAEITIPESGIELRHGDETIEWVDFDDVDVVTDETGTILYISISQEAYARMLEMMS